MNKNRFKSDMEAAWELRPQTDTTPESRAHINRFAAAPEQKHKKEAPAGENKSNNSK